MKTFLLLLFLICIFLPGGVLGVAAANMVDDNGWLMWLGFTAMYAVFIGFPVIDVLMNDSKQ